MSGVEGALILGGAALASGAMNAAAAAKGKVHDFIPSNSSRNSH